MSTNSQVHVLENDALRIEFDSQVGGLVAVVNKLTGERYGVTGDAFAVEATGFSLAQTQMTCSAWSATADAVTARYSDSNLTVDVAYELGPNDNFFQKRMSLSFAQAGGVKQVVLSRSAFVTDAKIVCYLHPDFDWVTEYVEIKHRWGLRRPDNTEPTRTFFGRTEKGGFFTGVEMPYDNSRQERNVLTLGYAPNLKVKTGERVECETLYFGVYQRDQRDVRATEWVPITAAQVIGTDIHGGFNGAAAAGLSVEPAKHAGTRTPAQTKTLPLPSESAAMTAMTSVILGAPRHGVTSVACCWHSQMAQDDYESEEQFEADLKSLEFFAACGIDIVGETSPWGGASRQMANLSEGDRFLVGRHARRFAERTRDLGMKVQPWSTMNNTHPWRPHGGPFRKDRPEWLRGVEGKALGGANADNMHRREANCFACDPFIEWYGRIILEDQLATGLYDAWGTDGDFWGTGAFFHTTTPATCLAGNHDHLPGDSNYACLRRLNRLIATIRQRYPSFYITACRPQMDWGVWTLRNIDTCFTLIESGTGGSNISAGDEVRTASRIRVHHHFFPHWLDWSFLFPSYGDPKSYPAWPSGHIDYLLLSALSCSPNLLFNLPTKTGIPDADKAEIRKWLDWGRKNAEYILVRHDLFDWPGKGKVDGSAHLKGDRGLIFLFNPYKNELPVEFALTQESVGFTGTKAVELRQEYPASDRRETFKPGATVRWQVPAETAVVLRVGP